MRAIYHDSFATREIRGYFHYTVFFYDRYLWTVFVASKSSIFCVLQCDSRAACIFRFVWIRRLRFSLLLLDLHALRSNTTKGRTFRDRWKKVSTDRDQSACRRVTRDLHDDDPWISSPFVDRTFYTNVWNRRYPSRWLLDCSTRWLLHLTAAICGCLPNNGVSTFRSFYDIACPYLYYYNLHVCEMELLRFTIWFESNLHNVARHIQRFKSWRYLHPFISQYQGYSHHQ